MMRLEGFDKLKKFHLIWTQTHDIPACSTVPQPTVLLQVTIYKSPSIVFLTFAYKHYLKEITS
jgi:hypothetical protein